MRDANGRFMPGFDKDRADNDSDEARERAAIHGSRGGKVSPGNFRNCPDRASQCGKMPRMETRK